MQSLPIENAVTSSSAVLARLQQHPRVERASLNSDPNCLIEFTRGPKVRRILDKPHQGVLTGLPELVDNNPMVCAESFALLNPAETLAHIALAPLLLADLVPEPPVLLTNFDADEQEISSSLATIYGYSGEVFLEREEVDLQGVLALNALVNVPLNSGLDLLDQLFEESYGRSYYVLKEEDGRWDIEDVKGRPWARYRLRITPGDTTSLLRIQVMADAHGKCGSAQAINVMNIMCGFEETLGL